MPWWQSKLEPPDKHRSWYDKTFNFSWGAGGSQLDYVLKGGDLIGVFAEESLSTNQKPFVTIRLNDGQMCTHPPTPDNCSSGVNNDHQVRSSTAVWPFTGVVLLRVVYSVIRELMVPPPLRAQFDRLSQFWWEHRDNASLILGLQQRPPEGFKPCCWLPADNGGCHCTNAACEFSWAGSSLARDRIAALIGELAQQYVHKGVHGISLDFQVRCPTIVSLLH